MSGTVEAIEKRDGRRERAVASRARILEAMVDLIQAGEVQPSPGPEFVFTAGDLLVVVGTAEGLDAAAKILAHG